MLWRNVNVSALDGSFKVLPKALHAVHMRLAAHILLAAMIYGAVLVALPIQALIGGQFIRVNRSSLGDVLLNDGLQGVGFAVGNNLRHYFAVPLQHSKHDGLASRTAPALAGMTTANQGFINLHVTGQRILSVNAGHVFANLVPHTPSAFVSHPKLALQFLGRYAVTGSGEQVNRIEPRLKLGAAILKERSNSRVKMMAAVAASVGAFCFEAIPLGRLVALGADMALTEAHFKQVIQAGFIGRELRHEFAHCDTGLLAFVCLHGVKVRQNPPLCQGDKSAQLCPTAQSALRVKENESKLVEALQKIKEKTLCFEAEKLAEEALAACGQEGAK